MRTQDQQRAKHAYDRVGQFTESNDKFKTFALKLPAMILQCGTLPTLAFYEKQKQDARKVFDAVDDWLLNGAGLPWRTSTGNCRERLTSQSTDVQLYRLAAREALAYGTWLKRATESILGADA